MAPSAISTSTDGQDPSFEPAINDVRLIAPSESAPSELAPSPPEPVAPDGLPTTEEGDAQSVAFDVSVQGYANDVVPESSGADLMAIVVCLLRKAQVRCCFVGEAALIYYGAHRIMTDWILCIDDDQFDTAVALLELESKIVHPFRHSAMKPNGTIDHRFPRYKFTGARCFFHVVPSWVYRVSCDDDSIEFSRKGLPFPKLQVFAQSLLETMNRVDLQDLIDGMNLTYEWGLENLVLEGTSDTTWAARRCDLHEAYGDYLPAFLRREGAQRMQVWKRVASGDARAKRRGHKALPKDETRFRLKGQKDPRDLHMW